ncbi:MAG: GNAT family N-acetyltransferase [Acidimicrobiales bacterium]
MTPDDVAHMAMTVRLADGTPLHLRPVVPADAPLIAEGFERLSPESRFLRFFSPLNHLSEAQLHYFTEIDYVDHFAWVAWVDADDGGQLGVGVARYIRSRLHPHAAEAAVAVADDFHRRGIGSVLIESLAAVALTRDIVKFHLLVRTDNLAMIAAMVDLGAERVDNDDPSVLRFEIDLQQLADDLRSTPVGSVFRLIAGAGPTH